MKRRSVISSSGRIGFLRGRWRPANIAGAITRRRAFRLVRSFEKSVFFDKTDNLEEDEHRQRPPDQYSDQPVAPPSLRRVQVVPSAILLPFHILSACGS